MAQQWRVECYECGKEKSDYERMHSQLTQKEVANRLNDDPRESPSPQSGTWVECNVCGTMREVNANSD